MKKLINTLFFAFIVLNSPATEFKGRTYSYPRISEEASAPNAYDEFSPAQEEIAPEAVVVLPDTPSLKINKGIENDEPDFQSSVFDRPAMTR